MLHVGHGRVDITNDEIANHVLRAFDALPAKFKPRSYETAATEWVPLAGIVVTSGMRLHK